MQKAPNDGTHRLHLHVVKVERVMSHNARRKCPEQQLPPELGGCTKGQPEQLNGDSQAKCLASVDGQAAHAGHDGGHGSRVRSATQGQHVAARARAPQVVPQPARRACIAGRMPALGS